MHGGAKLRLLLGLVLFALLAAAGTLWYDISRFAEAPLAVRQSPTAQSVDIPRGSSFHAIVDTLRQRHLSSAPDWYWRVLAMRMHVTARLHAGEYALYPGLTPRVLLTHMARGQVVQHDFTIVDGWNFLELRAALAKAPKIKHELPSLDDAQLMQRIGAGQSKPEGQFMPETYAYIKGDTDVSILKRAYGSMQRYLNQQWAQRADDLPVKSPYQALILASIVEKETARPDERERIAGVFERRLDIGMPLQTDPTIIYALGTSYDGNIHKRDLKVDSPYNTYTHPGLPPTPIAMPGKPAIHAVLHPAAGKALYFVARGDGSHVFSDTLAEHNRAVACYQLKHCAGEKR
ncbi:endolytic transglycosylase MltG [Oleiagrimonas sp. C23AA]|nr:endolytic transglycosylase MltG [Oleiagrimonas sp. C23AA]